MEYNNYRKKALNNLEVKKEYEALGPEFDLIQSMINIQNNQDDTQNEILLSSEIKKESK